MRGSAARRARWGAAWIVATGLLVLCFRGVGWSGVAPRLAAVEPGWLVAAVTANGAILVLWALQWRLFLPRDRSVPLGRVFRVTAVMSTVANSVPFLAGQAAGLHLLATRGGVGHATSLSVTALDQLAEGAAKVSVLLLLAAVGPLPGSFRRALAGLAVGVAVLAALLVWAARRGGRPAGHGGPPRAHDGGRGAETRWRTRVRRFLTDAARGLEAARRPGVLAGGVALALGMKAAEAAGIVAVTLALGVDVPAWGPLLVLAAVNLATMVSVAPANLGVYEGSAFLAWSWLGVGAETALALAVLQHVAYLVPMAGTGWVAVGLRTLRRRDGRTPVPEPAGD